MQVQSSPVRELFFDAKHVGEAREPNFVGRAASFECGAVVRVSLHLDEAQRIVEAKFKAAGCSTLVAATSLLIEQVLGKTTAEAAIACQNPLLLEAGEMAAGKFECALLGCEALIDAIRNYSDAARFESHGEGDEALICTCFCVSERTIEREIETHRLQTIAEVTAACNAGGGCRSCYPLIEEILEGVNSES